MEVWALCKMALDEPDSKLIEEIIGIYPSFETAEAEQVRQELSSLHPFEIQPFILGLG